jgi:hypothetical protein
MAIGVRYQPKGMTLAQYGALNERLSAYLDEQGLTAPEGALHLSVFGEDGALGGFEIWESETAFRKFEAVLGPIVAEVGIEGVAPEIVPIHRLAQAAVDVPWRGRAS